MGGSQATLRERRYDRVQTCLVQVDDDRPRYPPAVVPGGMTVAVGERVAAIGASGEDSMDACRRHEHRFAALLRHTSEVVMVIGLDGVISYVSPSVHSLFGYELDELVGMPGWALVHPDDLPGGLEHIMAGLTGGRSVAIEWRLRRADGTWAWIEEVLTDLSQDPVVGGIVANFHDVTARRSAQEGLWASEQRYHQVVETAREGMWVIDADGHTSFANQKLADMLRCGVDDLLSSSLLDFIHDEDRDAMGERLAERARGTSGCYQLRYRRPDGTDLWADISANPLYDAAGNYAGAMAMVSDITDQRRLATALRVSQDRFRRVFDQSPVGKAIIAPTLVVEEVNAALCASLGRSAAELVGTTAAAFTHPEDIAKDFEQARRLLDGEIDSYRIDQRYLRADGSIMIGRLTASIVRDDDGSPLYGVAVIEDVTEQVATQQALADRDERLRLAIEAADLMTWDFDAVTGRCQASPNFTTLLHTTTGPNGDLGPAFRAAVHPGDIDCLDIGALAATAQPDGSFAVDFRLLPPQSPPRSFHARGRLMRNAAGVVTRVLGTAIDLTPQRVAEQRRLQAELNYRRTIEASSDAFIALDGDGGILRFNAAAEATFGWTNAEAWGRDVLDVVVPSRLHGLEEEVFHRALALARASGGGVGPIEALAMRRDGTTFPSEVSLTAIETGGPDGLRGPDGLCGPDGHLGQGGQSRYNVFVRDITDRKAAEAELSRLALTDGLTGLPNRALVTDRLTGALSRLDDGRSLVGAVYIDVDRFKVVNDSLSHQAGDQLLVALAGRIAAVLSPRDTVGRLGGDEFVVVAEGLTNPHHVTDLAERIRVAVGATLWIDGQELRPSASIGVAVSTDSSDTAETLIADADVAMYRAKQRGGGRVEVFDAAMRSRTAARLQLECELRRAIDGDGLVVHYQPIVDRTDVIVGFEALVRWMHPQRGELAPSEFIALAEETGLISDLGVSVLRQACRQTARWRAELGRDLYVSVNVASRQLATSDLGGIVRAILAQEGLPASALCLEITESALITDPEVAAATLHELRDQGVRIAVDDYGTGYSSLVYLRRFPVQLLKLDRCFVAGLGLDPQDDAIIASSIALAHTLGLQAIAEGVETSEQLAALEAMGCDMTQGYLWSRPVPAAGAGRLLGLAAPVPVQLLAV